MEQKAFDLIVKKTGEALEKQGFVQDEKDVRDESGQWVMFKGENLAYSVLYSLEKKCFQLRSCEMTEEGPDLKWTSVSTWLFDPQESEISEAESIVNDFVETIEGPRRIAAVQKAKKKRSKSDDDNVDSVFFYNRLAGVFPELKDDLSRERATYGDVRTVTFAKTNVLPKMQQMAVDGRQNQCKKLCDTLNNMYSAGDLDVRSVISIVLLNGMDGAAVEKNMVPLFSEDLKKGYKAGLKFKGKNVKPEKKKKPKKYVADSLNDLR